MKSETHVFLFHSYKTMRDDNDDDDNNDGYGDGDGNCDGVEEEKN